MGLETALLAQAAQPRPQQQMTIAAPLNDVQLVALVAAQRRGGIEPKEAVEWAIEIVVEACVQTEMGRALADKIRTRAELRR